MKIKNISQTVIISLIVAILGLVSLYIGSKVSNNAPENSLMGITMYIVPIIYVFLSKKFVFKEIKLNTKDFSVKSTIKYGWFILLIALIFFSLNISQAVKGNAPVSSIVFYFIYCLGTGIFEELMCRGIIQNLIVEKFKEENKSVFKAIALAAFIFAILHFANLINNPNLILGTIGQVVYSFGIGIMLGVIYYKTKNIASSILVHALFNFLASFILVLPQSAASEGVIPLVALLIQWALILPGIFIYYRIYKKRTI